MAYRRRQGITRASTFNDDIYNQTPDHDHGDLKGHSNGGSSFRSSQSFSSHSSLAAQAIRASNSHDDATTRNESRGFWGILAQKAKSILEEDEEEEHQQHQQQQRNVVVSEPSNNNNNNNPTIRKSIEKITTTMNHIGDSFEKGRTIVESQIRKKGSDLMENGPWQPLTQPSPQESQLKASRDVAMATAAKAKLLLRELKTVKADLAFAKQRCSQLEEENKRLRDNREKGNTNPADDDLIRLQLETFAAESAPASVRLVVVRFIDTAVATDSATSSSLLFVSKMLDINADADARFRFVHLEDEIFI
ncbi:hypothetical protein F2Q69_00008389 [Brassica cretica]|uniref:Uncharacterized protein n=1 Tax=Brassica cretica TaxID=69181 RepID=A0A8S9P1W6_BRACR|nr:hypothetical protein F2Q69_00008389 [Brassica cretica]